MGWFHLKCRQRTVWVGFLYNLVANLGPLFMIKTSKRGTSNVKCITYLIKIHIVCTHIVVFGVEAHCSTVCGNRRFGGTWCFIFRADVCGLGTLLGYISKSNHRYPPAGLHGVTPRKTIEKLKICRVAQKMYRHLNVRSICLNNLLAHLRFNFENVRT
jgi:hypothetical protein